MLDKETFLKELTRYFDSVRHDEYKDEAEPFDCDGVLCKDCIFNKGRSMYCIYTSVYISDAIEELEKWVKEHPQKKFKVSQLEYDILKLICESYKDCHYINHSTFKNDFILNDLMEKGHFKGATKEMLIKDYFDNCEVKDE